MAVVMTLEKLRETVAGSPVAIRGKAVLEPAGGCGDKVFPPTHSVSDRVKERGAKYAREERRSAGGEVERCVLLDSVQSQANRMEEALEALWAAKKITLPVITVSMADVAPDVGVVTSLSAPHRIADALLRDSLLDGVLFRLSDLGKSFTDSSLRNAGPLFRVCPTGLLFGLWDSTGPKGGLGAKFARALVSEIVGFGAEFGVKTSSRIDPAGIVTKAAQIYQHQNPAEGWTTDVEQARREKGAPMKRGDGRVSEVNHSNVPPTIDELAGGVTIDRAEQTVVLSLAALRRLSFGGGDIEARTALAALGLLAILAMDERGHDLRSRCLLVPRDGGALALSAIGKDGVAAPFELDLEGAIALYEAAVAALPDALRFKRGAAQLHPGETLAELQPSEKLKHLVVRSRELAASGAEVEGT
ncbi:MAG: type I-U CRISPR-associated protein Cas7 [Proteobacteria bacterium]|nr:MAG: type I-U CRISPR-associated protein Cas7 [Pseudomonadota bacterium]